MRQLLTTTLISLISALMVQAKVELPSVFSDNMVLQQQTSVAIWGKAKPNSKIVITSTWSKSKTIVVADNSGKWFTQIDTPTAGGPYEMTFNDGEKVTLKNILIGEVWICSGQSNMAQPMKGYMGQPTAQAAEYITEARPETPIRSCNLENHLSLTAQDECPAKWYTHNPVGVAEASAAAYFFAQKIYKQLRIPVGIINVSWGGTPIEAWMNPEILKSKFSEEVNLKHLDNMELPETDPHEAAGVLYNGMLHSVIPFTAKGFLWYQGCHNRCEHELYKKLQPAFVQMLREEWKNEDMPFYFTQVAPFNYEDPDERDTGYMMWAQAQTLEMIPNSGMATTHDTGEFDCIHPANKKAVGDRLAFLALTRDYGMKGIDAEAPMPTNFTFKEGAAFVTFNCGEMGLAPINVELEGFELAGEDQTFYPAKATIQDDQKSIKVTSPEVANPVAVRYG
ncbi:MAG: sialate O-acetylesterase, partial [Bacteroidales bacterium]|nr:sialate O-acetylesterase [Bacteroidales bacterium]